MSNVYVVIRHNQTGRCFLLDRRYFLIDKDHYCKNVPASYCQKDEEWIPSFVWQKPLWARHMKAKEFTAYWYDPQIALG